MPIPEMLTNTLLEGTTGTYSFALVDEGGLAIDSGFLDTLTVTLYDVHNFQIVNGREQQNILNTNDGSVTTTPGPPVTTTVTLELQPDDTIMINENRIIEYRVLQFRWTWDNGTRAAGHAVQFAIENLEHWP